MFDNFQNVFKAVSKQFGMIEKNQRLTDEQFTIAFRRNSPLRERLSLGAPSGNREKKKRNVFILHCEKISTFSSRATRAHGREALRKTLTRGSERSTENPTGAELLAKNGSRWVPECYFWSFWVGFEKKKVSQRRRGDGEIL